MDKTKIELLSGTGGGEAGATLGGSTISHSLPDIFQLASNPLILNIKVMKKDHHVARWVQDARFHVPGARWDES